MALIVQKYGGSSVGSLELIHKVAARVAAVRGRGDRVVVAVSAMGDATDRLVDLAHALCPNPDPRELDALLATGEQVSSALLAMALHARGVPARSLTGSQVPIRTTSAHGRARIEEVGTAALNAVLEAGEVPVVAGFQGVDATGAVTTIGRGGSDTTAVALAVALAADECQILTDVDGVYTCDPRMVPDARRLERLSFDEMLELAGQGSRVLHLRAVEFAAKYGIALRVLASHGEGPGTLIDREDPRVEAPVVSGVAFNRDEAQIVVSGVPNAPDTAHRLLQGVSGAGIEVDMIVLASNQDGSIDFAFTVHRGDYARAVELTRLGAAFCPGARIDSTDRVAKMSIVGVGMRSHAGVAARLFAALARAGITVRLVSTSEIRISVLIDEAELERAVRIIHYEFSLSGHSGNY
ncbi:MAG TPA: aspartate kinase [Steroidobacteraceae bacterium]|nr:aspartate kinase [Steroidobacteraceae bacterium]